MNYVASIIDAFGGVRPMAKAIGKPVSTVQSWKDRASIPDEHKRGILAEANRLGINIGPADFFPVDLPAAGAA